MVVLFNLEKLATRNSQLATRNSQLATRNSQLATRNSQLALSISECKFALFISNQQTRIKYAPNN
ncbi:hypothetical protein PMAG_a2934 [Pseudoalteromonas mariniglutinosa NCIMB 1770]|nr:hypothetical protein [Pseudoalteromonas mariniglutinosa NCIMB 1770]